THLRPNPADVLHLHHPAPPFVPDPVVVTIHVLSFEHLPETCNRRSVAQLRFTVRRTARKAARILTSSEFSRRDIVETYAINPDRGAVTVLAAPTYFAPVENEREVNKIREIAGIERD